MLQDIVPAGVSAATTRADAPAAMLLPEEEVAVANATDARRREFSTARSCARRALEPWGFSGQAIPMMSSGAPRWPPGIVGSITHCDGFRACAVGRDSDLAAIGIDAEPNEPLPDGLLRDIAGFEERDQVTKLARRAPRVHWDRLLFCMKEAAYKAWFPLTGRRLGFDDAVVAVDPGSRVFTVRASAPDQSFDGVGLASLSGRWLVRDGFLLTALAVPAATAPPARRLRR